MAFLNKSGKELLATGLKTRHLVVWSRFEVEKLLSRFINWPNKEILILNLQNIPEDQAEFTFRFSMNY
jgi:hypothetical protein